MCSAFQNDNGYLIFKTCRETFIPYINYFSMKGFYLLLLIVLSFSFSFILIYIQVTGVTHGEGINVTSIWFRQNFLYWSNFGMYRMSN